MDDQNQSELGSISPPQEYVRPRLNRRESEGDLAASSADSAKKNNAFGFSRAVTGSKLLVKGEGSSPVMPGIRTNLYREKLTEVRAGYVQKPFYLNTDVLVAKSPYFARLISPASNPIAEGSLTPPAFNGTNPMRVSGPFFFAELDEYAFGYFARWLIGHKVSGPVDFHSMNHTLVLYVLADRFEIEELKNLAMDLVRGYYRQKDMTAPAFRLDYIYENTQGPNLMKEFLITTAAFRALSDNDAEKSTYKGITNSVKGTLERGGDVGPDYAEALLRLVHNGMQDVRKGSKCRWHQHTVTPHCPPSPPPEPWETD